MRAITYPDPAQRITYHPHSAPLHRIRTGDMLPLRLLTPFQAENDHGIRDTYNYATVQVGAPDRRAAACMHGGCAGSRAYCQTTLSCRPPCTAFASLPSSPPADRHQAAPEAHHLP